MNSVFLKLNLSDFGKGVALAVIVAVLGALHQILQAKGFDLSIVDFQAILKVAVTAFIGYLAKNFVTNSEGTLGKAEYKK